MGLAFGGWVWYAQRPSPVPGLRYLTGFVIEKSLSMDNIFVVAMIFGYFGIPRAYQYRVLFWGILAVVLLRGLMIGVGSRSGRSIRLDPLDFRGVPDHHRRQDDLGRPTKLTTSSRTRSSNSCADGSTSLIACMVKASSFATSTPRPGRWRRS
jgi:hypothetical protein